jgi:hypothetical protein
VRKLQNVQTKAWIGIHGYSDESVEGVEGQRKVKKT